MYLKFFKLKHEYEIKLNANAAKAEKIEEIAYG